MEPWTQEGHGRCMSLQEKPLGLAKKSVKDREGSGEESSGREVSLSWETEVVIREELMLDKAFPVCSPNPNVLSSLKSIRSLGSSQKQFFIQEHLSQAATNSEAWRIPFKWV